MKRVVSSSIITLLIFVAAAAAFLYFKNFRNKGGDPIQAIPADVAFIMVYDVASDEIKSLLSMEIWPILKTAEPFRVLEKQLAFFDTSSRGNNLFHEFMKGQPFYITGHVTGAGTFDFLFLKSLDNGFDESSTDDLIKFLTGVEEQPVKRNYDGNSIREVTLEDGQVFSYVIAKEIFLASYTPFLVEDALRQMKLGKPVLSDKNMLNELRITESSKLCLNFKNLPLFSGVFLEQGTLPGLPALNAYGDWIIADILGEKNKLQFTGSLLVSDSTQFVQCFTGQHPVEKRMLRMLPRKTAVINYFGLENFGSYYEKLSSQYLTSESKARKVKLLKSISENYKVEVEEKMLGWIGNEYALVITEPAGMNYENNSFAVFRTKDIKAAKKSMNSICRMIDKKSDNKTMEEIYNGHSIGFLRLTGVIPALFGEAFGKVNKMYYTDIEDYIIFGNQPAAIRSFIDEYESGLLLFNTKYFQTALKLLPLKGNQFVYIRPSMAIQIFKSIANAAWKKNADQYKDIITGTSSFCYQLGAGDQSKTINAVINFSGKQNPEGVDQAFAVASDTSISVKPLLSTDPVTKTRQLLFQDDAGNIYLTDNSGNLIWKQPVDGTIMSEIFEIDLFKNNTRQFLFNTAEYLYLIDTKGTPVGNYPIRLPAAATNGISVFDFDKNKDFKIYVACENRRIYAYLPSGKPLPGWNFRNMADIVTDPIRSVPFNGRELLVINDRQGGVAFVNRFGEQAIQLSAGFQIGKHSGFYKMPSGSLIVTDALGSIIEIQTNGNIQTIPLNTVSADHGFLFADADGNNEPDYIFLEGKELMVYNKQLALIYRKEFENNLFGGIQLFLMKNNKMAMGVRSVEADKTWLLNMDGTVYPGFPVKGCTQAIIDEINLDGNKNFIVGGKDHHMYVYSLN